MSKSLKQHIESVVVVQQTDLQMSNVHSIRISLSILLNSTECVLKARRPHPGRSKTLDGISEEE